MIFKEVSLWVVPCSTCDSIVALIEAGHLRFTSKAELRAGTLQVSFQQSPSQEDADADLRINVRTARGQIVYIDGSKTSAEGVIDVDWREVK